MIQKNVLSGFCNTTWQVGTSNQKASRNRESPTIKCLSCQLSLARSYNPVLGEFFRCRYDYPNGTNGFYIAEQGTPPRSSVIRESHKYPPPVSHHPPVSVFFYISPANHVSIFGELRPKSKFLGNSVSTTMEGENRVTLLAKPDDGGTSLFVFFETHLASLNLYTHPLQNTS